MENNNDYIKSCPFCGGSAHIFFEDKAFEPAWFVLCTDDVRDHELHGYCIFGASHVGFETEQDAINAWNNRVEPED